MDRTSQERRAGKRIIRYRSFHKTISTEYRAVAIEITTVVRISGNKDNKSPLFYPFKP